MRIVLHILDKRDGVKLSFSLLLYIIKWTEGGEKISVGSLI